MMLHATCTWTDIWTDRTVIVCFMCLCNQCLPSLISVFVINMNVYMPYYILAFENRKKCLFAINVKFN